MKRIYISLVFCLFSFCQLRAQAPQRMAYQAVIRNAGNSLVINAPISLRVSIIQGTAFGASTYVETHTIISNANGLVTLEIGGGTALFGSMNTINWKNGHIL